MIQECPSVGHSVRASHCNGALNTRKQMESKSFNTVLKKKVITPPGLSKWLIFKASINRFERRIPESILGDFFYKNITS